MNVKFSFIVCEKTVGLVSSVVLGSHSPVYVGEYGLFFEVYSAKYSAAYFGFPLLYVAIKELGIYQLL